MRVAVTSDFKADILAPHSGQSSQLVLYANGRYAQFLPAAKRSALNGEISTVI